MGSKLCKCCCRKTNNSNVTMEYAMLNNYKNEKKNAPMLSTGFRAEYQAFIADLFPGTDESRIVQLTYGYIRKHYGCLIPDDLSQIILCFVGGVSGFGPHALMTSKEIKEIRAERLRKYLRQCTDCIADQETALRHLCGFVILVLFGAVGTDIACLIINSYNHCNDTMDESNKYVAFDLNAWILYGSISHIAASCLIGTGLVGMCFCDLFEEVCGLAYVTVICIAFPWFFFVSWMVIGFLFYSEMDNSDKQCTNVVLSWLVIQAMEIIVIPFLVISGYILSMLYCDD